MFWTLLCPSSGVCDYAVELPHWSYGSWFAVCWRLGVVQTRQTKNDTTNVIIQQHSRKLPMMDIIMSETC